MAFDIDAALTYLVEREGSDLHLKVGSPPVARVHGDLWALKGAETLTGEDTHAVLEHISKHRPEVMKEFSEDGEADFAYTISSSGGELAMRLLSQSAQ